MTPFEVRPSGGTKAVGVVSVVMIVTGVVVLAVAGVAVPLVPALWVGWYPVLLAARARVTVIDGELRVQNPFLSYRFPQGEVAALQVVRLSSNWNLRRAVDPAGWQRLRILVINGVGRDVSVVATDRFRFQTGIPPEFQDLADSLGVPLQVRS